MSKFKGRQQCRPFIFFATESMLLFWFLSILFSKYTMANEIYFLIRINLLFNPAHCPG